LRKNLLKLAVKFSLSTFIFLAVVLHAAVLFAKEAETIGSKANQAPFNHKTLTIAINKTSFPYHFVDEQGEAAGLMPDLWRLWAEKQQAKIKFVTLPWRETLKQVATGNVDIHAGLSIIDGRKDSLAFSQPLFPLYTHVYVNADLTHVQDIDDLSPYAIGVVDGSAHIDMLTKKFPQLEQKMFSTRPDLYKAAINKEILIFTGLEKLSTNYQYYQQLNAMYPAYKRLRYQQGDYGIAVAKKNTHLLEFIEDGFAKISQAEKSNIERKWLGIDKRKDSLSIAFPADYPPYAAQSPTGQPQGFLIDMWRLWAKQSDTQITFIARNIEESLSLIDNNDIDVLVGFPETWLDQKHFSLAKPIYQSKAKMFIRNNFPNVKSLSYFDKENINTKVGIWQNTPFKEQLLTKYPHINFKFYPTIDTLVKAAELEEIDVFVALADFMDLKLLKENLQTFFYTLDMPSFKVTLSPLIKKGNSRLIAAINEGFEQIELEQLVTLEDRWLSGDDQYYKNLFTKISLTEQEDQLIAQNKAVRVGFLKSLAPTEFIDRKGKFSGITRDILDLISLRTGLRFDFIGYDSWQQLYQSMLARDIDIIPSITPTEEREEKLLFSTPYWKAPWVILHPQYMGRQSQLSDFYGKSLAIVKDFYLVNYLRENHPLITLEIVKTRAEGLQAIQRKKVDGLVETIASASQLLKQESLVSLTISVIEDTPEDNSHFGLQKNEPLLVSIFDKGIASISVKEKDNIHEKWFSVDINTGFDKSVVMRVALQVALLIVIILAIIIMWNRRLKTEITHRKQLEEKMKHMASHDDLTGLANRMLLKDRINTAIEFHQRQSLLMAVLFLDLDGFKNINDTYGHDVGDDLLVLVAQRLLSCVRTSDTVVRFGGDEFVLLLTGLHHSDEANFVADKVLQKLQSPFELEATSQQIGCSIGIAMFPDDGANDAELLKAADTLMYQVKAAGKNHYLTSGISSTPVNDNNN